MRAVIADGPGGPDQLRVTDISAPEPKESEILLEVHAAGVNRADILQRQGLYPPPRGASDIIGLEVSGIVLAAPGDGPWQAGDRVCALLSGGGYAERAAVPAAQLLPLPAGLGFEAAAALPEALCTIWYNLVLRAGLAAGETLLVHGGGSGIGTMAIQVARALGARVACTAGSAAKLEAARALGADVLINYREEDFAVRMREEGGADVILDIMGAAYLAGNVSALRTGGRLVVIGLQGGRTGELDLAALLMKQGRIEATSLRALPPEKKAQVVAGVRRDLWPLVEAGKLLPVVDRVLPLDRAAEAHHLIEASAATGKIVLAVA